MEGRFRLYGWRNMAITLGRFQRDSVSILEFCEEFQLAVTRRITGGQAVLHGLDITFAAAFVTEQDARLLFTR